MEDMPDMLGNFWITIVSAICMHIIKKITVVTTAGLFKPYCKDQDKPDLLEQRSVKAA